MTMELIENQDLNEGPFDTPGDDKGVEIVLDGSMDEDERQI